MYVLQVNSVNIFFRHLFYCAYVNSVCNHSLESFPFCLVSCISRWPPLILQNSQVLRSMRLCTDISMYLCVAAVPCVWVLCIGGGRGITFTAHHLHFHTQFVMSVTHQGERRKAPMAPSISAILWKQQQIFFYTRAYRPKNTKIPLSTFKILYN